MRRLDLSSGLLDSPAGSWRSPFKGFSFVDRSVRVLIFCNSVISGSDNKLILNHSESGRIVQIWHQISSRLYLQELCTKRKVPIPYLSKTCTPMHTLVPWLWSNGCSQMTQWPNGPEIQAKMPQNWRKPDFGSSLLNHRVGLTSKRNLQKNLLAGGNNDLTGHFLESFQDSNSCELIDRACWMIFRQSAWQRSKTTRKLGWKEKWRRKRCAWRELSLLSCVASPEMIVTQKIIQTIPVAKMK